MKKLLAITLALVLTLGLFAVSTGLAEEKQKVVVWTWYSEQLGPSVCKAFEEKFPQYEVEAVNIPSAELEQKLLAGISAGSGVPDCNSLQGDSMQKFIAFGGLTDITDLVQPLVDDYPLYKIANDTGPDGRIYGLPIDTGPCALYYQTEIIEECGIDPETDFATWDSWVASGAKFKENGYSLSRMTEVGDAGALFMWVQQQGQSFFDEAGNPTIDTPEFINAATLLKDLWDSGTTGDWAEWTAQYADAVVNKEVATLWGAAWYMNVFIHSFDEARDWAIVPLPTFPDSDIRTSNQGGSEFVIPEDAENKEGAWEFMKFYLASVESLPYRLEALGEFPAYLPLYQEPMMQEKTLKFFGDQKTFVFFSELLPSVPSFRTPGPYIAIRNMVAAECPKLLIGELSPVEFAEHCQSVAEGIVRDF